MPYPTAEDAEDFPWVTWYNPLSTGDRSPVVDAIPLATGIAAVSIPYAVGAALVVFGPTPYHKALGVSMLVPGPQDLVYFAAGYYIGDQFVQTFLE